MPEALKVERDQMALEVTGTDVREILESTARGFKQTPSWVVCQLVQAFLVVDRKLGMETLAGAAIRETLPPELADDLALPAPARARG